MADVQQLYRIKELIIEVLKDARSTKESMDEKHEWDSISEVLKNLGTLIDFAEDVAATAVVIREGVSGIDITDEEVIDVLSEYVDELIKLPFLLEKIDKYLIKIALTSLFNTYKEKFKNNEAPDLFSRIFKSAAKVTK